MIDKRFIKKMKIESKNSRITRISPDFSKFMENTKQIIAKDINVNPKEIPNTLITSKITNWAKIGKCVEQRSKNSKMDKINSDVSKFLDKITT